jgi:hypothetical protein
MLQNPETTTSHSRDDRHERIRKREAEIVVRLADVLGLETDEDVNLLRIILRSIQLDDLNLQYYKDELGK